MTMRHTTTASPLGPMLLAADAQGLRGAWFLDQRHFPGVGPDWCEAPDDPVLVETARQLAAYFAARLRVFDLPLAPRGTSFQRAVWGEIARVGYGRTRGYGDLAGALGRPGAARAVGAATGRNPLSIIIPCHRLVAADGALTGYDGGLARKRALLALEAAA